MIRKKALNYFLSVVMIFSVGSCDMLELDINTDPNNPSEASLSLLLTNAEYSLASTFAGGLNNAAHGFMGITTSTDDFDMTNGDWNDTWNGLYSGGLNDLERLIVAAEAQGNNPRYLGIGRVLKAYYFSLMVDLWGDVPYSEAFKGDQGIKQPAYDVDADIYQDLINLCDLAITNFNEESAVNIRGDVIYGDCDGDDCLEKMQLWIKAANSLKLRLLVQIRTASSVQADIQAIVNSGDYIQTAEEDFQFRFSRLQNPDNRHPWYQSGYAGGEAAFSYFGHQYMFEMLRNGDPRTPYYFKRQTTDVLDPNDPSDKQTIQCSQRDDCIYSYFVANPTITNALFGVNPDGLTSSQRSFLAGWFGRDRSDPSGIPNDNPLRTTVGAYPAGGLFDDVAELGGGNKGTGDGIFPMITSWMVKFYLIESMITEGVTVDGETEASLLGAALSEQIAKVQALGEAVDASGVANGETNGWPVTYADPEDFVDDIVAGYPAAGIPQKLQYLMKQAWFANFGNGFEIYNAFRRTGFPNDIQEPLQRPRQFALRLPYAQDELNLNGANVPTIIYDSPTDAIFWDGIRFQFN